MTGTANGRSAENFNSVREVSLHYAGRGKGGKHDSTEASPPDDVIEEIDSQELNKVFVKRYIAFSSCSFSNTFLGSCI